MATVLAYAETREGTLRAVALEAVTAARTLADELGADVTALLVGAPGVGESADRLAAHGADRIAVAEDEAFRLYHPDGTLRALQALVEGGDVEAILLPASAQGKDLAPRLAARLGVGLATEATAIEVEDGRPIVRRPEYAGKAIARVGFRDRPALVSLRPNVFQPAERPGAGEVERLEVAAEPARQRVLAIEAGEGDALDVSEAAIVVSGGRGMGGPENWHLLEELREALGGKSALGASRAVVDAGWRPHSEQVGQTGKVVAPTLYVAVGISGAIQHLAGMRTARTIVAINKDPEAPIFEVADYGIVGDLFEVVPRLTEEIRSVRSG